MTCALSHCKAVTEPSLDPRTPIPGLRQHIRHGSLIAGRPAVVRSTRYTVQCLPGRTAKPWVDKIEQAPQHSSVLRGFGRTAYDFKYSLWVCLSDSVRLIIPEKGMHFLMQTSPRREINDDDPRL